jgi:hypothetical protein
MVINIRLHKQDQARPTDLALCEKLTARTRGRCVQYCSSHFQRETSTVTPDVTDILSDLFLSELDITHGLLQPPCTHGRFKRCQALPGCLSHQGHSNIRVFKVVCDARFGQPAQSMWHCCLLRLMVEGQCSKQLA